MFPSSGLGPADHLRDCLADRGPRIAAPTFHCAIHPQAERAVLAPTGELDIDTAPLLDGALRDLRDVGFETLVVDLRGLTFIDSQGIQLLLRWTITAARRGHAFRLLPGPERVQMVLAMTGLLEHVQFEHVRRAA
jgi:anti-sigma B factor antagonist